MVSSSLAWRASLQYISMFGAHVCAMECGWLCMQDTTVAFSDAVREAREEQQTQQREQEQKKAQELEGSIDADLLEEWDARLQRKAAQQTKSGSQRNGSA